MGNPVEYAEKILGVHLPYDEAEAALTDHGRVRINLSRCRNVLRDSIAAHEDRARQVTIDATGEYGLRCSGTVDGAEPLKFSQAGLERFVHDTMQVDPEWNLLRDVVRENRNAVETLEAELDVLKARIEIKASRLNELAGLLTFYAMRSPAPKTR